MRSLDATHAPGLKSWVESAQKPGSDFPIQNLPFGRFRRPGRKEAWRCGVAIGDHALDLHLALGRGSLPWAEIAPSLLAHAAPLLLEIHAPRAAPSELHAGAIDAFASAETARTVAPEALGAA